MMNSKFGRGASAAEADGAKTQARSNNVTTAKRRELRMGGTVRKGGDEAERQERPA
jgi:hypothetical protein